MIYNHPIWHQNVRAQDLRSINQNICRVMPPGLYPYGHWVRHNAFGQPVHPITGKPGPAWQTHVPLPGPRNR